MIIKKKLKSKKDFSKKYNFPEDTIKKKVNSDKQKKTVL